MSFEQKVKKQLRAGEWDLIEKFDDGTSGANEVGHVRLRDGTEIIHKVMLAVRIAPPDGPKPPLSKVRGRQRRKAITEVTFALLDKFIGDELVAPNVYAQLWEPTDTYDIHWGEKNIDGYDKVCEVIREYAPKYSGEEWRGEIYKETRMPLHAVDAQIKYQMSTSLDAQRIAILDMLTINQDRSARNWATDGERFYAIDNGMAWFHEYPDNDGWKGGCVIDDVIIQIGSFPKDWRFISGVFSTLWENEPIHEDILGGMKNFDKKGWLNEISKGAVKLGFPKNLSEDWRFYAILKRMGWMVENKKLPSKETYRGWLKGSKYMTPPEVVKDGGKIIWLPEWDK